MKFFWGLTMSAVDIFSLRLRRRKLSLYSVSFFIENPEG